MPLQRTNMNLPAVQEMVTLPGASSPKTDDMTQPPGPLDNPTQPPIEAASFSNVPAAEPKQDGMLPRIPGYELLGTLGRGGMGVVYKARHMKLNRLVALKMILAGSHAGAADWPASRPRRKPSPACSIPTSCRSTRSASTRASRSSRWSSAAAAAWPRSSAARRLPAREAAALVETLARAMQAAHDQHIIHRDLKPANVLLDADRIGQLPKITDFGLAKKLDEAGQTQSGAIMGTPSLHGPGTGRRRIGQ